MIGVYKISVNKYYYIGASIDVNNRLQIHKLELNKGNHHNKNLQAAYNKYGNLSFKILHTTDTVEEAFKIEAQLVTVKDLNNNYCTNHIPGGTRGVYGLKGADRANATLKSTLSKSNIRYYMVLDRNENLIGKFIGSESVARTIPISAASCYKLQIGDSKTLSSGKCQGYTIVRIPKDSECQYVLTNINNKLQNRNWESNSVYYKVIKITDSIETIFKGAPAVCDRFKISVPTLLQLINNERSVYTNTKRNNLLNNYKFEKL